MLVLFGMSNFTWYANYSYFANQLGNEYIKYFPNYNSQRDPDTFVTVEKLDIFVMIKPFMRIGPFKELYGPYIWAQMSIFSQNSSLRLRCLVTGLKFEFFMHSFFFNVFLSLHSIHNQFKNLKFLHINALRKVDEFQPVLLKLDRTVLDGSAGKSQN